MPAALPIVFVPGASSDASVWDGQKNYFARRASALSLDLTAFDAVSAMADHVLENAPPEFILCGTSMGGYVALDVLKKAKARVRKAIFCNTSARADTPEKTRQRQADVEAGEAAYIEARRDPEHYKVFLSEKSFRNKALVARLQEVSARVGYGCFRRHQAACSTRPCSLSFLPQIDMPVLVIGGTEDKVTPPELQREMQAAIPGARLVLLPDAGHIAHLEAAEAVTAEIDKFLMAA